MPIASWLLPVLWRELDWGAALERFRMQLAGSDSGSQLQRAAAELGRAYEYVVPDRRRAIAVYELAGPAGLSRARDLALELGWWSAHARLVVLTRGVDPDPRLVLDEAEAWWDAGHGDLGALAFAGARSSDDGPRAVALAALTGGGDLEQQAAVTLARATATTGADSADAYVMTARLARAAGRPDLVVPWLEAALAAVPNHRAAASFLFAHALHSSDPDQIQRYLKVRLDGLDGTAWLDAMRSSALALIGHDHRGLGLRLLRHALERAYESEHTNIPGHLAIWTVLAANASADGNRRELLPLVITGLQSSQHDVDRVWLGALATEISLRDAGHAVVAGAYAEIVAELAPEHPIVRELIGIVASPGPAAPIAGVSSEAVRAATALEDAFGVDVDLGDVYAGAAGAATLDANVATAPPQKIEAAKPATAKASIAPPSMAKHSVPTRPVPTATAVARPVPSVVGKPSIAPATIARPAPVPVATTAEPTQPPAARPASIVPAFPAKSAPLAKPAMLAKPAETRSPIVPASAAKSAPLVKPALVGSANTKRPDPSPFLAALRTPDRPIVPPTVAEPADAVPRARRIPIPIDLRLVIDGKRIEAHSRDISTTGLFVLTGATLVVGAELAIELLLPGAEPFMEDEYKARARIARSGEGGYGVELLSPDAALVAALAALR